MHYLAIESRELKPPNADMNHKSPIVSQFCIVFSEEMRPAVCPNRRSLSGGLPIRRRRGGSSLFFPVRALADKLFTKAMIPSARESLIRLNFNQTLQVRSCWGKRSRIGGGSPRSLAFRVARDPPCHCRPSRRRAKRLINERILRKRVGHQDGHQYRSPPECPPTLNPTDVSVTADGGKVYVTNILSDLVTVIDKATNTPKRTF